MPRSMSYSASTTRYDTRGVSYLASSSEPATHEKLLEDILVVYNPLLMHWQFPLEGVKYNVDASWDDVNKIWIIAIAARDTHGGLVFGKVMAKENPKLWNKSFEGELFGIWQAAVAARENLHLHPATYISIETDSKHVAEHIDGDIEDKYRHFEPEIMMMRQEMLRLYNEVPSLDVFHVPRHCNKLADKLARWAKLQCVDPDFMRRLIDGGVIVDYSDIQNNFVGACYLKETDPRLQDGYQSYDS